MRNALRRIALQVTIPVLCGLIVVNTYVVSRNLKLIQSNATRRVDAAEVQADISNLLLDLQDMETGQRGFLLTGDPAYLKPYNDANAKLASDFSHLRSRVAGKSARDRALESRLESVTNSKVAEMQETISLRERGYRRRAFVLVNTDRGKVLMDDARATLNALSSAQTSNIATFDREMTGSVARAVQQSVVASCILLLVTIVAFLALNIYRKRLEVRYTRQQRELHATTVQLEQLTATVFNDFGALARQVRDQANTLLDVYGGFLPRQGQEKAERIENGAGQMIRLLDGASNSSPSATSAQDDEVRAVHTLSA